MKRFIALTTFQIGVTVIGLPNYYQTGYWQNGRHPKDKSHYATNKFTMQ